MTAPWSALPLGLLPLALLLLAGCGRDAVDVAPTQDARSQAAPAREPGEDPDTATPTEVSLENPWDWDMRTPQSAVASSTPDATSLAMRAELATEAVASATGAVEHSSDIAFPGFGLAEFANDPDVIVSGTLGVEVPDWRWEQDPRIQDVDALISLPGPPPSWPWIWRTIEVHEVLKGEDRVRAGEHLLLRYSDPRQVDSVLIDGLEAGKSYLVALNELPPLRGHADPSYGSYFGHYSFLRVTVGGVRYASPDRHRTEFALDMAGADFLAMLRDELARQAIATPTRRSDP